jgi:hypothetical protein
MFSDTFAGIAPASAPMFVLMQLLGGAAAFGLIRLLYPRAADLAADLAEQSNPNDQAAKPPSRGGPGALDRSRHAQ